MKIRNRKKGYAIQAAALCVVLMGNLTACGNAAAADAEALESQEELLTEVLTGQAEGALGGSGAAGGSLSESGKVETVYVIASADGQAEDIIVSEWLKNGDRADTLEDVSELDEIENVKGYETFTQSGSRLVWDAKGADIYYQGSTKKELPVAVKITYQMDGKEMAPEDIAGKSGHVCIRLDYENKETRVVTVDGQEEEIFVPFTLVSGMILPQDTFSNIQVTNGELISEGNNSIVMGVVFPGLKDSLRLDEFMEQLSEEDADSLEIPDYIEISADVENFELGMTMTVAMSDVLSGLSDPDTSGLDDLNESMEEMRNASSELKDGTSDLKDGSGALKEGTDELANGVGELWNGAGELKDGTSELYEKSGELNDGAVSLDEGAASLADGAKRLDDGAQELSSGAASLLSGAEKLSSGAGTLRDGAGTLQSGTQELVGGTNALVAGAGKLDEGARQLEAGITGVDAAVGQLKAAVVTGGGDTPSLTAGANSVNENMAKLDGAINAYFTTYESQLTDSVNAAKALIEQQIGNTQSALDGANAELGSAQSRLAEAQAGLEAACQPSTETVEVVTGRSSQTIQISGQGAGEGSDGEDSEEESSGESVTVENVQTESREYSNLSAESVKAAADAYAAAQRETADLEAKAAAYSAQLAQLNEIYQAINSLSANSSAADKVQAIAAIEYLSGQLKNGTATLAAGVNQTADALTQIEAGTGQLAAGAGELTAGTASAVSGARELQSGASALNAGAGSLKGGLDELAGGASSLKDGAGTLKAGTDSLKDGAGTLRAGTDSLKAGTGTLRDGTARLIDGTGSLDEGASALADGVNSLMEGAAALQDGAGALDEGAAALMDGMFRFDEEGIRKITDLFGEDARRMTDRMRAVSDAGKEYRSFTGIPEGMDGNVRFLIKTAEIKAEDGE